MEHCTQISISMQQESLNLRATLILQAKQEQKTRIY